MINEKQAYLKFTILSNLKLLFYFALFVNDVMIYKLVDIFGIQISAASLIFPATYTVVTIIAEGYDYKEAKKLVYQSVYVNILFGLIISILIKLPSPEFFDKQSAFLTVFPNIFNHCIAHGFAAIVSYSLNIYLLRKLKIFYIGRSFLVRSVTAILVGELSLTLIMVIFSWHDSQSFNNIVTITISTYSSKLLWAIFGAYPALVLIKTIHKIHSNREKTIKSIIIDSDKKIKEIKG
jgi:queuosine precursor transporter